HEGHEGAEDEQRAVAQPLAQVLGGHEEGGAHQSLRALPVRCRNTDSRSGSLTSTRATLAPASETVRTMPGSRRPAPAAVTCRAPPLTSTLFTPSSSCSAAAAASSSPAASSRT